MNNKIILLTGAKKNIGDFLITDRATKLIANKFPQYELLTIPYWEKASIEKLNKAKAIIILGGPGIIPEMYPKLYKFTNNLELLNTPIFTLGSGWYGRPGLELSENIYIFKKSTMQLLKKLSENIGISVRDDSTYRVLKRYDLKPILTGCPVWYNLSKINQLEINNPKFDNILITPAQSDIYYEQNKKLLDYVKDKFSHSNVVVSFHRGIDNYDEFTREKDLNNSSKIAQYSKKLGFKVVDTSFSLDSIKFYDEMDFHIGYRVHGHIYFLSGGKPSLLLHEDGRGVAASRTLCLKGIDAFTTRKIFTLLKYLPRTYIGYKIYAHFGRKSKNEINSEVDDQIESIKNTPKYYNVCNNKIKEKYLEINNYLDSIKGFIER